jgi:hypothetical protein
MVDKTILYKGEPVAFSQSDIFSFIYDKNLSIQDIYQNKTIPARTSSYHLKNDSIVKENSFGKNVCIFKREYLHRNFGSDISSLNNLLHYQSLIEYAIVDGVVIDLTGRIEPGLLDWMNGKLIGDTPYSENIELNYRLPLPSGNEYVFTLKPSKDQTCVLEPINNISTLTQEDNLIIRGFSALLKYEPKTLIKLLSSSTPIIDFYKPIWEKSLQQQTKEENITTRNLQEQNNKSHGIYNQDPYLSATEALAFIKSKIQTIQDDINASEQMKKIKKSYLISGKSQIEIDTKIDKIANETYEHIKLLQREYNPQLDSTYIVELDINHIVIDMIQEFNKTVNQKGRNYKQPERFLTSEQLKSDMAERVKSICNEPAYNISIVYNDKVTTTEKASEHKAITTLTKMYIENIEILHQHIPNFEKERLQPNERKKYQKLFRTLTDINTQQQENGLTISTYSKKKKEADFSPEILQALMEQKNALLKEKFDIALELNTVVQNYFFQNSSLQAQWNTISHRLISCRPDNIIKYIYVVNHNGNLVFSPEQLNGDIQGRAAHSELGEGRHIYAAGEIAIQVSANGTIHITEINNGSGHYRPSPESVIIAYNALSKDGFDISEAQLVNSLGRFAKLKDGDINTPVNIQTHANKTIKTFDFSLINKIRQSFSQPITTSQHTPN